MKTKELVREFTEGATKGSASGRRLIINGNELINYSTTIGLRTDNFIIVNEQYYSKTTSKHQNRLKDLAQKTHYGVLLVNEEQLNNYKKDKSIRLDGEVLKQPSVSGKTQSIIN